MKRITLALVVCCLVLAIARPSASEDAKPSAMVGDNAAQPMNLKYKDAKWSQVFPELAEKSPMMTILRVDPVTKATHLMIRVPKNFHVPAHWHTANETHTILTGEFTVLCNGTREELTRGDFNFVPSKMQHEAWSGKDGALLLITVDGPWDLNWVNGTPKPSDMLESGK